MKTEHLKNMAASLALVIFAIYLAATPVYAGLRVTGAKIQDSVLPGQVRSYVINVAGTDDEPADIKVDVRGLGNYPGGSPKALNADEDVSPYSARGFITASPASFHLEPGQAQDVTVNISIPQNVGNGGRYAIVVIHTVPGGGELAISTAVVTLVILTIDGSNLIISGDIASLGLVEPKPKQPLAIAATVNNTGNYHYKVSLNGTVKDDLGQIVGTAWKANSICPLIPSFTQQVNVLFNTPQDLAPGAYTAEIEAYTSEGILLDRSSTSFVLNEAYKHMPLKTLAIEFWDTGKAPSLEWDMSEDGTLMEAVDASSLTSMVTITIPQGAKVSGPGGQPPAAVSVTLIDPLPSPPARCTMISAFNFKPADVTFDPKADITLEYPAAQLPKDVSEATLKIATFNQTTLQWRVINSEVDTKANKISFSTTQSGIYAIVAPPTPKPATILGLEKGTWIWAGIGGLWIAVVGTAILSMKQWQLKKAARNTKKA